MALWAALHTVQAQHAALAARLVVWEANGLNHSIVLELLRRPNDVVLI